MGYKEHKEKSGWQNKRTWTTRRTKANQMFTASFITPSMDAKQATEDFAKAVEYMDEADAVRGCNNV